MPRLIFINRYFHPDASATSRILSDLAFYLAGHGYDVHVVAGRQLYDEPGAHLPPSETINNVGVHRLAATRFGRAGLLGRSADYLTFYASTLFALSRLTEPGSIVVAKTDPPLLSLPVSLIVRWKKARLINWMQDIYPETALRLGVQIPPRFAKLLTRWRDKTLRDAIATVVPGVAMARYLENRGAPRERLNVISNWIDDEKVTPVDPGGNPLRVIWNLHDKFVVAYAGNLGRAHEVETLLAAAETFRDEARLVFLLIGGGHRFEHLERRVEALGLKQRFRFLPYQSAEQLKPALAAADVHWLSLKAGLGDLIFPSKFYGIAAAGRPMIAVVPRDSDIASLVEANACGLVVVPGDGKGFGDAIRSLAADANKRIEMGRRARAMLDKKFTRQHAFARWQTLLARLSEVP